MMYGTLLPRHDTSSGCGQRIRPVNMKGSCENIEYAITDVR